MHQHEGYVVMLFVLHFSEPVPRERERERQEGKEKGRLLKRFGCCGICTSVDKMGALEHTDTGFIRCCSLYGLHTCIPKAFVILICSSP